MSVLPPSRHDRRGGHSSPTADQEVSTRHDEKYIFTPDLTMQVGRALVYMTIVNARRVGFLPGTTDLAFGEFVPYLSSTQGLQIQTESARGISTSRLLPPTVAMSTQTDPARDFSDRDNDSMMSCTAEPPDIVDADATAKQFAQMVLPAYDVDYGSMVPSFSARFRWSSCGLR